MKKKNIQKCILISVAILFSFKLKGFVDSEGLSNTWYNILKGVLFVVIYLAYKVIDMTDENPVSKEKEETKDQNEDNAKDFILESSHPNKEQYKIENIKNETNTEASVKWYNNKLKLGLSLVFFPLFLYGLYKTKLLHNGYKLLVFGIFIVLIYISETENLSRRVLNSDWPEGEDFMSKVHFGDSDHWTDYTFGADGRTHGFHYNQQLFNNVGYPINHIHKMGTYTINGNQVTFNFDEGQTYQLEFRKIDGETCLIDINGEVLIWDDPVKREENFKKGNY